MLNLEKIQPMRGFTLLEIIISFTILTMSCSVLFIIAASGLQNVQSGEQFRRAAIIAQSRLALAVVSRSPPPLLEAGIESGGFRWRLQTATIESHLITNSQIDQKDLLPLNQSSDTRLTLVLITVTVTWPSSGALRELRLDTTRILINSR